MHVIKKNDVGYVKFGEAYFSTIIYRSIKAWKKHNIMTLNLVVPIGKVSVVIYDDRVNSKTKGFFNKFTIGSKKYCRLTIPPSIWFGFEGLAQSPSIVLNIADIIHDQNEVERKKIEDLVFNWESLK